MLLQTLTFLTMPISLIFWLWELWLSGGVGELPQHRAAGVIVTARSRTASSEVALHSLHFLLEELRWVYPRPERTEEV